MAELEEYTDDYLAIEELAAAEMRSRGDAIDAAWAYYRGDFRQPLKVEAGQPNDNVIVNLVKRVVNQTVSMLVGYPPGFEAATPALSTVLGDVWDANHLAIFLHKLVMNGALSGHNFVKLLPDTAKGVRLVALNPRLVTVYWKPEDLEEVVAYKIQWARGPVTYRQDVVKRGDVWQVIDMTHTAGAAWTVTGDEVWPWPFAPVVDWQNLPDPEGYYGQSDLTGAHLNDNMNLVASNTSRIIKIHAHPKTIGTGMKPADVLKTSIDSFWAVPSPDAKLYNLEMQSDLGSSMAFMQFLAASFYAEHQAVDIATIKDKIGQLTNLGLRLFYKDALDKTTTKQMLYGAGLRDISEHILQLLGYGEQRVELVWQDMLPNNDLEEISAIQQEVDLGILSRETATGLRNRDWKLEQKRIVDEEVLPGNEGASILAALGRAA